MALLDAYALRGLKPRGRAYGPVRLWGSASFIVANLAAGLAFDIIDTRDLIWLLSASAIATAMAAIWLMPLPQPAPLSDHAQVSRPLWRNPGFLAIVVAASLVQSSHAVYYGFSTIGWKAAGFDGVAIGALWAIGRDRGDRAVRAVGPAAAGLRSGAASCHRCGRRGLALDRDGVRSAGLDAAACCNACTVCPSAPRILAPSASSLMRRLKAAARPRKAISR